ncbi:MAG: hypothetical protein ACRD1Q_17775 [Vicinamibacterales bacterium]
MDVTIHPDLPAIIPKKIVAGFFNLVFRRHRSLRLMHAVRSAGSALTSVQQRLVKTGGRWVKHARYYRSLLAESHLTRRLFGAMLRRIWALPVPAS